MKSTQQRKCWVDFAFYAKVQKNNDKKLLFHFPFFLFLFCFLSLLAFIFCRAPIAEANCKDFFIRHVSDDWSPKSILNRWPDAKKLFPFHDFYFTLVRLFRLLLHRIFRCFILGHFFSVICDPKCNDEHKKVDRVSFSTETVEVTNKYKKKKKCKKFVKEIHSMWPIYHCRNSEDSKNLFFFTRYKRTECSIKC